VAQTPNLPLTPCCGSIQTVRVVALPRFAVSGERCSMPSFGASATGFVEVVSSTAAPPGFVAITRHEIVLPRVAEDSVKVADGPCCSTWLSFVSMNAYARVGAFSQLPDSQRNLEPTRSGGVPKSVT